MKVSQRKTKRFLNESRALGHLKKNEFLSNNRDNLFSPRLIMTRVRDHKQSQLERKRHGSEGAFYSQENSENLGNQTPTKHLASFL